MSSHTVTARSRTDGQTLSWTNLTSDPADPRCEWTGGRSAVLEAQAYEATGEPVDLSVDIRSVTPDEGFMAYSIAVMHTVLGPVDWITPPPDGWLDEFRFEDGE